MARFRWCAAAAVLPAIAGLRCQAGPIDLVVDQVTVPQYTAYLDNSLYTHAGSNRGGGTQHDLARQQILSTFQSLGLTTSLDDFAYSGATYYNVVGVLPGALRPNDYYVIGAHYDSANTPGADDNASGVAGVMEAARAMSRFRFAASVVFIAFDREEQGLVGSTAWAVEHSADHILGMISLDMIAYNPAGATHDQARLYTSNGAGNTVTSGLDAALETYGGLTAVFSGGISASDHYPFGTRGFPSALLIESSWPTNPNYHRAGDTVDTAGYIDYEYATAMTRGVVGFVASEAEVMPEPRTLLLLACGIAAIAALRATRRRRA